MNRLVAEVETVASVDILHLISLRIEQSDIKVLTLELPQGLAIGSRVELLIKPTNIIISKEKLSTISTQNQLTCSIEGVHKGEILAQIVLHHNTQMLEALIPQYVCEKLSLKKGDEVVVHLLESALSLGECQC